MCCSKSVCFIIALTINLLLSSASFIVGLVFAYKEPNATDCLYDGISFNLTTWLKIHCFVGLACNILFTIAYLLRWIKKGLETLLCVPITFVTCCSCCWILSWFVVGLLIIFNAPDLCFDNHFAIWLYCVIVLSIQVVSFCCNICCGYQINYSLETENDF